MGEDETTKVLYWFIATLIGSVGLNQGINKVTPTVRNDPFTGSEGREMERRLDRIDSEQQKMIYRMLRREEDAKECRDMLQTHLRRHP